METSEIFIGTTLLAIAAWFSVCVTRFAIDYGASPWWFLLVALAALGWAWVLLLAALLVGRAI